MNKFKLQWNDFMVCRSCFDKGKELNKEVSVGIIEFDGTFYRCNECDSKTVTGANVLIARLN